MTICQFLNEFSCNEFSNLSVIIKIRMSMPTEKNQKYTEVTRISITIKTLETTVRIRHQQVTISGRGQTLIQVVSEKKMKSRCSLQKTRKLKEKILRQISFSKLILIDKHSTLIMMSIFIYQLSVIIKQRSNLNNKKELSKKS